MRPVRFLLHSKYLPVQSGNKGQAGHLLFTNFQIVCHKQVDLPLDSTCYMNSVGRFQSGLNPNRAVLLRRVCRKRNQLDFATTHKSAYRFISCFILDHLWSHENLAERKHTGADRVSALRECVVSGACQFAEDRVSFQNVGKKHGVPINETHRFWASAGSGRSGTIEPKFSRSARMNASAPATSRYMSAQIP